MRFIRKEFIVTTIFNKELTERDEVLIVFNNLLNERIEFAMTMKKYMPMQQDYFNMSFEKVRVKRINDDDTVDLLAFKSGVKTNIKGVPFDHIIEVNATTKKHKILDIDSDLNRFDILDL
jgi:hypothetical protein